jgi:hypothetical protein
LRVSAHAFGASGLDKNAGAGTGAPVSTFEPEHAKGNL